MYCYGKNVARDILASDQKIDCVFLADNFKEPDILSLIHRENIKKKIVDKRYLDRIADGLHQGIVIKTPDYDYHDLEEVMIKDNAFVIILDHLEDPHNFGAIIRTAEAAGVDGIIIPKDRSVEVSGTVMKVSAGALDRVPIIRITNIAETIRTLKENGFWIVGTDMEGSDYRTVDYRGKMAITIGNEGSGISPLVRKNCDFIASIPMKGEINSLNASVATAIVIFEAVRQRG